MFSITHKNYIFSTLENYFLISLHVFYEQSKVIVNMFLLDRFIFDRTFYLASLEFFYRNTIS